MDPRIEHRLDDFNRALEAHWIALTGIAVALVLGGGFAKALTPSELYHVPPPTQLIADAPQRLADSTYPSWPGGRVPDYVIGTDLTNPNRAMEQLPAVQAAYAMLTPGYDDARYGDSRQPDGHYASATPAAYDNLADTEENAAPIGRDDEPLTAAQAAVDDTPETLPALAPG
jgi:hypothetical protein